LFSNATKLLAFALVAACGFAPGQETAPESRPASSPAAPAAESQPSTRAADAAPRSAGEIVIEEPKPPLHVAGMLSLSYRGRTTDGASDNDAYGYLSLDVGDSEVNQAIFHMMGRVTYDFDNDASDKSNPFGSLNDIDGDDWDSHLYEAWVDLDGSLAPCGLGLDRIRVGRQNFYASFTYLVDGVRFDFERVKSFGDMRLTVFGGIPEYLYEESRSGDWIAGFDAGFRPWKDGRLDLRYAHVEDSNAWVEGDAVDDYLSLTARHRFTDDFDVWATWNTIDAGTRDASIRFNWVEPCHDLMFSGAYRYQATITNEYTTVYDPYVGVLGTSYAYHQLDLEGSKVFCNQRLGLDAGFSARILQDSSNEAAFNHEFIRAWTTLSAYKWPCPEIDLSATGELWLAEGDETASIGADLTWRPKDKLTVGAGTYYSLYKHDLFVVDERQDVTTLFLKVNWRPKDCLRLDGRLEVETGDEGEFLTAIFGATWSF
jgi:hypothetical protein